MRLRNCYCVAAAAAAGRREIEQWNVKAETNAIAELAMTDAVKKQMNGVWIVFYAHTKEITTNVWI